MWAAMYYVFLFLIAASLLVVVGTLFMGMYAMFRGGEYGRANSNKFMRYRVWTQAVAVGIITVGLLYMKAHPGG